MRLKSFVRFFENTWQRIKPIRKRPNEMRSPSLLVEMLERRDLLAVAPTIVSSAVLPLDGSTLTTATPVIRVAYSETMSNTVLTPTSYVLLGSSGSPVTIDSVTFDPTAVIPNSTVLLTYNGGAPGNGSAQLVVDTYSLFVKGDRVFDADDNLPMAQPGQLIVANANGRNVGVVGLPGDGTLSAISNYNLAGSGTQDANPREVAFGDLDGDGIKDLVVVNAGTSQAFVYLGRPATIGGGYDTIPNLTLTLPATPVNSVRSLVLADLNKDNKIDIAVTNSFTAAATIPTVMDSVSVFLNTTAATGAVTFGVGTAINVDSVIPTTATPPTPVGITAADYDNDGNVDLAVLLNTAFNDLDADTFADFRVAILSGDGLGGFAVPSATSKIKIGDAAGFGAVGTNYSLASANVTGDNKQDLIIGVSGGTTSGVYVFTNTTAGAGTFTFAPVGVTRTIANVASPGNSTTPTAVRLAGGPGAGFNVGDIVQITGVTGFTNGTYTVAAVPSATATFDFDLGGTASATPIIGNGGTASTATRITTSSVKSIATGNMNADGTTDIIVTTTTNTVEILRNLGGGNFAVTSYAVAAGTGGNLTVSDLDNNGRDDILISNGVAAGKLTVMRNDSAITSKFGSISNITGPGGTNVSVTTSTAHNLSTGDEVFLSGISVPGFNGTFTITRTGNNSFTLNGTSALTGSDTTGSWSNRGIASVTGTGGTITFTTTTAHGLATGDRIVVSGVVGYAAANNGFAITVLTPTTFTVAGGAGTASGTGAATFTTGLGGTVASVTRVAGPGQNTTVTTSAAHGLATGDRVTIAGVLGLTGVAGSFIITVASTTTFTLNSTGAAGTSTVNTGFYDNGLSFTSRSYDVGSVPLGIAVTATSTATPSDVNQDGIADVAIVGNLNNAVTILPGKGDATLQTGTNYALAPTVTNGVAVGDINGDAIADIITFNNASSSQTRVTVLQGLGGGRYADPSQPFNSVTNPWVAFTPTSGATGLNSIAIADINGDSRPDIILTGSAGGGFGGSYYKVSFLRNNIVPGNSVTAGSFSAFGDKDVDRNPLQVAVGDFNKDGAIDLAIAHNGSGGGGGGGGFGSTRQGVDILLGIPSAPGTFGPLFFINGVSNFLNGLPIERVVVGDFNKDGNLDFVASENATQGGGGGGSTPSVSNIYLQLGNGAGLFTDGGSISTGLKQIGSLVATDIDNDGFLDIVAGSKDTGISNSGIAVLLNGQGSFSAPAVLSDVVVGTGINSIVANDINQDGLTDIIAATIQPAGVITSVSGSSGGGNSGLFRITSSNHGLVTGDQVTITGSNLAALNGTWTITVPTTGGGGGGGGGPSTSQFDLNTSVYAPGFTGMATWTRPGGVAQKNNVFVKISNGDGTFQIAVPYEVGAGPTQTAAPSFLAATPSPLIRITTFNSGGTIVNSNLIANGNFESVDLSGEKGNLLGWQSYDLQPAVGGSHGAYRPQTLSYSPLSLVKVGSPSNDYRAMLDQSDINPQNANAADYAGSHALYQDITIPANTTLTTLSLSLYIQSLLDANTPVPFSDTSLTTPAGSLDYQTPQANQQVRIDIMRPGAAQLSVDTTPLASGTIASAVGPGAGNPIVVTTSANHNLTTGAFVSISGVSGFTAANGLFRITVTSPTSFTLNGTTAAGAGSLNSGTWGVPGDVLLNIFQTTTGTGTTFSTKFANIDLSVFAGQTIRLRIASANNQGKLIVGVDDVRISSKYSDTFAPTIAGLAVSNPSYIDASGFAHTNDPTLIGKVTDDGGINNLAYIEIDPSNQGFTGAGTVRIKQWDAFGNFQYKLPTKTAGFTTIAIRLVDRAGNTTPASFSFFMQANSVTEWEPVGPQGIDVTGQGVDYTKVSGRVTSVVADASDPTGNTYFVGSVNGGVWKTTNGGSTWVSLMNAVTDSTGNPIPVPIGGLAQSTREPINPLNLALGYQTNQNVLYAATGVGDRTTDSRPGVGILKSVDHGQTWTLIGNSGTVLAGARISKMVVDADNHNIAYAGVTSGGASGPGIYKTTDGGLTWVNVMVPSAMSVNGTPVAGGTPLPSVTDFVIDPTDSGRLLVGLGNIGLVADSALAGLWFSSNKGGSWAQIRGGDSLAPPAPLLAIPNSTLPFGINVGRVTVAIGNTRTGNEGFVYVMISTKPGNNTAPNVDFGSFSGLYRSKDNMLNFTKVMLKADMGGQSWRPINTFGGQVHDFQDINLLGRDGANAGALYVDPTNPNVVYVGGSTLWQQAGDPPAYSLIRVDTSNMRDTSYAIDTNADGIDDTIPNDGEDIDKFNRAVASSNFYYYNNGAATFYDPYRGEGVYWHDLDSNFSNDWDFANGRLSSVNRLPEVITSINIDSQGRLLVGTNGGIWRGVPVGFGYDNGSGGTGIVPTTSGGGGGFGGGGSTYTYAAPGMNLTSINGNLAIADMTSVAIDPNNRGVYFTTQTATGVAGSSGPLVWSSQGLTGPTTAGGTNLGIPNASAILSANPAFGSPAGTPVTLYRVWQYANAAALQPETSADNGATWGSINSTGISVNIPAGMFPAFAVNPTPVFLSGVYRNQLAFGTQVIYLSRTDGTVWDQQSPVLSAGEDVTAIAFSPSTAGVMYAATSDGKVFYTSNPGQSVTDWPQRNTATLPAIGTPGVYVRGISVDPTNPNVAYLMYGGPSSLPAVNEVQSITIPATVTDFTLTFNGNTTGTITYTGVPATDQAAISAALNLPAILGAGGTATVNSLGGGVFSISYGGTLGSANQPQITSTVTGGTGPIVAATLTQGSAAVPSVDHVYVTTNAGLTWSVVGAQAISAGGLPKVAAYSMVIDRNVSLGAPSGKLYLATEVGVFYSINNGATWARLGEGMPNVPVVDLKLDTDRVNPDGSITKGLNVLAAATLGRGVFTINTAAFSFVADQTINEDTPTPVLPITINDPSGSATYTLSATTSNGTLIPQSNIIIGGSGVNRTIQIVPAANLNDLNAGGPVTITVTLSSPSVSPTFFYTQTFKVSVTPVNDLPTITAVDTVEVLKNSANNLVNVTVGDVETPAASIIVTATSADQTLIPNANITVTAGAGGDRTIHITPAANLTGNTQIIVRVDDLTAGGAINYTFNILVNQPVSITPTPFTDNFARPDNSFFLGAGWTVVAGDFDLVAQESVATGTPLNIVTLNGLVAADAVIETDVNLAVGSLTYEGIVARYTASSYYWGALINLDGAVYAQIYTYQNGVFLGPLSSQLVTYTPGTNARLRFEVIKDSLKLFLNDALVGYANDTTITAPATFGMMANQGNKFDNFSASSLTATNVTLPFAEPFNAAPPRNQLSSDWRNLFGNFTITGSGAAASAVGIASANLATVNTATPQTDGFAQANVTIPSTHLAYAGVVARYTGDSVNQAGFTNMYVALLIRVGDAVGQNYVQLYKHVGAAGFVQMSSTPVGVSTMLLRIETIGDSIQVFDGTTMQLLGYANDATLPSGSYGMMASQNGVLDNFSTGVIAAGVPSFPYDFNALADGAQLPLPWVNHAGMYFAQTGAMVSQNDFNVATLHNYTQGDVAVEANLTLGTPGAPPYAGLVGRYNYGVTGSSYYTALLIPVGSTYYAQLYRFAGGVFTQLASADITAIYAPGVLFRMEIAGDSLKLFVNGTLQAYANDAFLTSAAGGSVGVISSKTATVDNFNAAANALTNVSIPPTFVDDFIAADNSELSASWLNRFGKYSTLANAITGDAAFNLATLNGVSLSDVAVLANGITLDAASGSFVGAVARYNGSGIGTFYWAGLVRSGTTITAEIRRYVNGAPTTLASRVVSSGTGDLQFNVVGNTLQLLHNTGAGMQLVLSTSDAAPLAAGTGGMYASAGSAIDQFQMQSTPTTPATVPLAHNDAFAVAPGGTIDIAQWSTTLGGFTGTGGAIAGLDAINAAILRQAANAGNTSTQVDVNLAPTNGAFVGLFARSTGAAFTNTYFAALYRNGTGTLALLYKYVNGSAVVLDTQTIGSSTGTLKLDVVGDSLRLYLNGTQIASALDASLATGSVGIVATQGNSLANFSATSVAPLALPFGDAFAGSALGTDWAVRTGGFNVAANTATGAAASGFNLATLLGVNLANVDVSATASLLAGQAIGLSARFTPGVGFGTQYYAYLIYNGTSYTAFIYRIVNGNFTLLTTGNVATFAGQMRFKVTGATLEVFFNGSLTPTLTTTDTALAGPGSVGMSTFGSAFFSNFQAN